MRAGLLDPNRVALCAYLYHKPSELALDECNKGDNFIWFDRVLNRHEPVPLILDLRRWGGRATIMAACGVISNVNRETPMTDSYFIRPVELLETILNYAKEEGGVMSLIKMNQLRSWPLAPLRSGFATLGERYLYTLHSQIISERTRRQRRVAVPRSQSPEFPGLSVLVRSNVNTSDAALINSIRSEIIPWALEGFI